MFYAGAMNNLVHANMKKLDPSHERGIVSVSTFTRNQLFMYQVPSFQIVLKIEFHLQTNFFAKFYEKDIYLPFLCLTIQQTFPNIL